MQFEKGQSGNPAGRPRGSRNKSTLLLEQTLANDGEAIVNKAIEMAKDGDPIALRLCIERLLPRRKHEPIECELPPIEKAADAVAALTAISAAVGAGDVAPSEAAALGRVVDFCVRALAALGFDERLTEVEARAQGKATRKTKLPGFLPGVNEIADRAGGQHA